MNTTIILPACLPRSKGNTGAILDALDVEHRKEWQPGFGGIGWSHCNQATETALGDLEAPLPPGLLANEQGAWLLSAEAWAKGWAECTAQQAGDRADAGEPTVVTLHEMPHGHIAIIRGRDEHGNLLVWQAGQHNFRSATLRQCFTIEQLQEIKFFTHR